MGFVSLPNQLYWVAVIGLGIAIASATQDIAIDAFRVDTTMRHEKLIE